MRGGVLITLIPKENLKLPSWSFLPQLKNCPAVHTLLACWLNHSKMAQILYNYSSSKPLKGEKARVREMPGYSSGVSAFCSLITPHPPTISQVRMGRWIKPIDWNTALSVCKAPRRVHLVVNCYNERWAAHSLVMLVPLVFQAEVNVATWMTQHYKTGRYLLCNQIWLSLK